MGGQACVFYGAAEFSRDIDIAIVLDEENILRLEAVLEDIQAIRIAVPPFELDYLQRGHAVHFRSQHPESDRIRLDVMSKMRGVDPFPLLWERRTSYEDQHGETHELMSLPDLVKAKKTQRDKDWPMIRLLLESNYLAHKDDPTPARQHFWLMEHRTATMLIDIAKSHPELAHSVQDERPLIEWALEGDENRVSAALIQEEQRERLLDRLYWEPLKAELQNLRRLERQE